jgi:hypothetical protein
MNRMSRLFPFDKVHVHPSLLASPFQALSRPNARISCQPSPNQLATSRVNQRILISRHDNYFWNGKSDDPQSMARHVVRQTGIHLRERPNQCLRSRAHKSSCVKLGTNIHERLFSPSSLLPISDGIDLPQTAPLGSSYPASLHSLARQAIRQGKKRQSPSVSCRANFLISAICPQPTDPAIISCELWS